MCRGGDGAGDGHGELGLTWCWSHTSLLSVWGTGGPQSCSNSVQAEFLSPPKADLWVSDELGHSTSTVTFPLHHGEDAARGPGTLGVLQLGEDDVVC